MFATGHVQRAFFLWGNIKFSSENLNVCCQVWLSLCEYKKQREIQLDQIKYEVHVEMRCAFLLLVSLLCVCFFFEMSSLINEQLIRDWSQVTGFEWIRWQVRHCMRASKQENGLIPKMAHSSKFSADRIINDEI